MTDRGAADNALRALVLTAGLGTRLEPLTYLRAKAAVPVNGETLSRRVIRWLAGQGIHDVVLNLHHLPATITGTVGDGSDLNARVRYSWENPVLGSAGGPKRALPLLVDSIATTPESRSTDSSRFFIVNGDTLTDVDLAMMLSQHVASGAAVTMALIPNPRPEKYGGVAVAEEKWVTGFTRAASGARSYHFIGVQIAEARAFESVADGLPSETVNEIYPRMIASNRRSIGAFICDASFQDIGTPGDYLDTSVRLAASEGDRLTDGHRTEIDRTATLIRTAIWDDVRIGARAELVDCVVCDGAAIPSGARYRRCAILPAGTREPRAGQRIEGTLLIAEI